jgi:hypothetical protein
LDAGLGAGPRFVRGGEEERSFEKKAAAQVVPRAPAVAAHDEEPLPPGRCAGAGELP